MPLGVQRDVAWAVPYQLIAEQLADSLLGSAEGVTRCVIAHFARARRAHSLDQFAQQLVFILTEPLHLQLSRTSVRMHANWEVPYIALSRRELQLIAVLAAHQDTFRERSRLLIKRFACDDVMQRALDVDRAITCVIAFVATLPCGFLAAPLATLCVQHKHGPCRV